MITKDLGIATAYGYALSKGYEGTEEEFATLMASYATTAQTAVEAAERAVAAQGAAELAQGKAEDAQGVAEGKATEASGSADSASADALKAEGLAVGQQNGTDVGSGSPYYHANAKYYKEQAAGSATTASNKAGEAAQSATDASNAKTAAQTAQGKAEDAQTAAETAQGKAEDAQEAAEAAAEQAEQTLNSYAHVDGYYEQMTVGNAEQLVSTVGVEDKVPYLFRTSGGSADIGDREVDEIIGGTIAWNQLYNISLTAEETLNDVAFTKGNGYININGTASAAVYKRLQINMNTVSGHKMLVLFMNSAVSGITCYDDNEPRQFTAVTTSKMFTASGEKIRFFINIANGTVISNVKVYPQLIDLTQMFGSTIADYIYTLEQNTAGSGVAFFRNLFPKPYYAYDAGTLMSVCTNAHKTVGFNAFDKSSVTTGKWLKDDYSGDLVNASGYNVSDFIPVVPGVKYYKTASGSARNLCYDANKNVIGGTSWATSGNAQIWTMPSNAAYIRLTVTDGNLDTFCLNLHWDGERDGEYEPYVVHTYALDDVELRGIPKLDANNKLFYDGDSYESDGTVTRRYGIVDLGSLTWGYSSEDVRFYYSGLDFKQPASATDVANAVCDTYAITKLGSLSDKCICLYTNGYMYAKNSAYTDAATFKTAMSGVYLVYELATPTTETADPYNNPQIVSDWGTEEYVDALATAQTSPRDVAVPVGHDTTYQNNLRAKLEMSPESPSGNGDYIVRQANGQNTYVQLTFPADELPSAPTTDGAYMLKCTISNGSATYTWESIT